LHWYLEIANKGYVKHHAPLPCLRYIPRIPLHGDIFQMVLELKKYFNNYTRICQYLDDFWSHNDSVSMRPDGAKMFPGRYTETNC
jgi:hypothetical protein